MPLRGQQATCHMMSHASKSSPGAARTAAIFSVCLLISACVSHAVVNERTAFWKSKVAQDLRPGMTRAELEAWALANHIRLVEIHSRVGSNWGANLESVRSKFDPLTGCHGWTISLGVRLDAANEIINDAVRTVGDCI